jgi:hypothetical protein
MKTSIVLDCETLALTPRSVITEIAALAFDEAGTVIDHIDLRPDIWEQLAAGREVDGGTLEFHRAHGTLPTCDGMDGCIDAAVQLAAFFREHKPEHVWMQGTDFDRPLVEDFCRGVGQPLPWRFSISRDARTLWDLAFPGKKHPPRPHRALADCEETLACILRATDAIRKPLPPLTVINPHGNPDFATFSPEPK